MRQAVGGCLLKEWYGLFPTIKGHDVSSHQMPRWPDETTRLRPEPALESVSQEHFQANPGLTGRCSLSRKQS